MRYPQVLVYESDGRLAEQLRREGRPKEWVLREPRRLESCLRLLQRGGPSVLVLKVGKDLLREFTLLERVGWLFPETPTLIFCDTENRALAALAWDLGAAFVLFPPLSHQRLPELVAELMGSIDRPGLFTVSQPVPSEDEKQA
jgi:hypothetical protein